MRRFATRSEVEMYRAVGDVFREQRQKAGWTVTQAANECDLSYHTYDRLEAGAGCNLSSLFRAAKGFHLELFIDLEDE